MNARASFSAPAVKRALKVAMDIGLVITDYEIESDESISVRISEAGSNGADAALDAWSRGRSAKRQD